VEWVEIYVERVERYVSPGVKDILKGETRSKEESASSWRRERELGGFFFSRSIGGSSCGRR